MRVSGTLERAYGYKGDSMNLPVADVETALPFYETVLGFQVLSRSDSPHKSALLGRDRIQMQLVENGGDPSQDGCAFHVTNVVAPDGLCYWFGESQQEMSESRG